MTVPLACLVGFSIWTLLLVIFGIGGYRVLAVVSGRASANAFPADAPHGGPDWYRRVNRAHLNCVENLPVFATVVLVGAVVGASSPLLDGLAITYLAARVLQTLVHVASTSVVAVNVRFTFFGLQLVCVLVYAGALLLPLFRP